MKMRAAVADGDGDDDGAGAPVQVSVDPAAYRDWSALPDNLLLTVMESLAIPDLFRAGTACASCFDGSICALDLSGSSPVARNIVKKNTQWDNPSKYVVLAPWGDLLEVWRLRDFDEPDEIPECSSAEFEDRSDKWLTEEIMLYKVDIDKQKLVKISSIGDHALFLGFNSVVCLPTNKFPMLKPDCAYLSDEFYEEICVKRHNWREIGIWDLKSCKLQSLGDVESLHAWRNWPSPIWITPSLN
uniref:KIB1-4 beta-propeller domain-containing protein n=1 Tax=Oryza meridionalis TaxID=40149 RepID=A0A0E0F7C4_9ORYZ